MIRNFGKKVRIEVYDATGAIVLNTAGLRIDFDVRLYQGYNRAKFTIFNLTAESAREISTGERYVRLYVSLHDGPEYLIANDYYVNNSYTEKKVPNSLTTLYCVDRLYKEITSKQVAIAVKKPTLKKILTALEAAADGPVSIKTTDFPDEVLNTVAERPLAQYRGEFGEVLQGIGKEYNFNNFIQPNKIIEVGYKPLYHNLAQTKQATRAKIVLQTRNMRSNPVVGVSQLQIESNLDANIGCNSLLDTSALLTAGTDENEENLQMVKDYLKASVAGYSIYAVLSVNHLGSSHTNSWSTKAIAITVAKGTHVNNFNWNL